VVNSLSLSYLGFSSFPPLLLRRVAWNCGTYAGIAQLVEPSICNREVGGSSPSTGTSSASFINITALRTPWGGGNLHSGSSVG
jgi:hypothetical protein